MWWKYQVRVFMNLMASEVFVVRDTHKLGRQTISSFSACYFHYFSRVSVWVACCRFCFAVGREKRERSDTGRCVQVSAYRWTAHLFPFGPVWIAGNLFHGTQRKKCESAALFPREQRNNKKKEIKMRKFDICSFRRSAGVFFFLCTGEAQSTVWKWLPV